LADGNVEPVPDVDVGDGEYKAGFGRRETSSRIEPTPDQIPLLQVAKEHAKDGNAFGPGAWGKGLARALHVSRVGPAPISSMPLADDRCGMPGQIRSPVGRRGDFRMCMSEPTADVEQEIVALVPV